MASTPNHATDMLVRKLERFNTLSSIERQAVERLPITVRPIKSHEYIQRVGDNIKQSCLIVDGWLHQYKMTSHGGRQIYSFDIPGDIANLKSLHFERADRDIRTLTTATLAFIPNDALRELANSYSSIGESLWRDTMIGASVLSERMTSMGRRSASEAVAHLICELYLRLKSSGLAKDNTYSLPLIQQDIGDAIGISSVHINRVLKELRDKMLIKIHGREVVITKWRELSELCDFDPGYLHACGDNGLDLQAPRPLQLAGAE